MAATDGSDALPAAIVNNPDAGHQAGVFPPFDPHNFLPQIIWLVLIFGALYLLMSRIALPRVAGILEARHDRIVKDLDDARMMQDQAQAAGVAYHRTLADARGRAQGLAQQTHDQLHAQSEARRHTLESELNGRLAAAEARIAETKARAMGNVEGIARDAASAIVQHLTGKSPGSDVISAATAVIKAP